MLPLLPAIACLLLVALPSRGGEDRRIPILRGLLLFGALTVLGSEVLGALGLITRTAIGLFWGAVIAITAMFLARARQADALREPSTRESTQARLDVSDRILLGGLVLLFVLLCVVVVLTSPNTHDVMTYHMPRVTHWAQGESLAHYPTHDSRQLYHPPFAELIDLSFFVLGGAERFVAPVRVVFFAGLIVATSLVAARLGAGVRGQVAAAFLAATMPSAVGLVPSGKNGPILAFCLTALVALLLVLGERLTWRNTCAAGIALGLAMLTKLTGYIYAAPFLLLFGIAAGVRHKRQIWKPLLLAALIPIVLNAGQWLRNQSTYGLPFFDPGRSHALSVREKNLGRTVSNLMRHTSAHLGTPSSDVNGWIEKGVRGVHGALGIDPDDRYATVWSHPYQVQTGAGSSTWNASPFHVLSLLAACGLLFVRRDLRSRRRVLFATALFTGFLLSAATLRWSLHVPRLQFPLVVLGVPLAAAVFFDIRRERKWARWGSLAIMAGLFAIALRDTSQGTGRRLFGKRPEVEMEHLALLFRGTDFRLQASALEVADWLAEIGAQRIGLLPQQVTLAEYPLWVTLGAHIEDLHIEQVQLRERLDHLSQREPFVSFVPEAVLFVNAPLPDARLPFPEEILLRDLQYVPALETERVMVYTPAAIED